MHYEVVIRAVITKTYKVEADDPEQANYKVSQLFTVENDGTDESYAQDILYTEQKLELLK